MATTSQMSPASPCNCCLPGMPNGVAHMMWSAHHAVFGPCHLHVQRQLSVSDARIVCLAWKRFDGGGKGGGGSGSGDTGMVRVVVQGLGTEVFVNGSATGVQLCSSAAANGAHCVTTRL